MDFIFAHLCLTAFLLKSSSLFYLCWFDLPFQELFVDRLILFFLLILLYTDFSIFLSFLSMFFGLQCSFLAFYHLIKLKDSIFFVFRLVSFYPQSNLFPLLKLLNFPSTYLLSK